MKKFDDITDIKTQVLTETAKHAFKGDLDTTWYDIPYHMLPGTKAQFRCCIYHERAIVKQRVKLAMGILPDDIPNPNVKSSQIVHVIPCACEGCPITKITVTQNCRGCLAKKCVKACPFGAISTSNGQAVIDKEKCRECGRCVGACPYNAIVDVERPCIKSCAVGAISIGENDIAVIDTEKCINCGHCVSGCPFGAISDISALTGVIDMLVDKKRPVYAIVAPSIEGQFGNISLSQIKAAIRDIGFDDVFEAAYGADIVAFFEAAELNERVLEGKKLTSSCCPAFVNLVQKHFPQISDNVSYTVSPMAAAERYIRKNNSDCSVVFIGPCIAKKNEVETLYKDEIDAVLTFEELNALFLAKDINFDIIEAEEDDATKYGKGFALSGGVSKAVTQALKEMGVEDDITVTGCDGAINCKKTLTLLKVGNLPEDFIEGMYCQGGCINGPAALEEFVKSKRAFEKLHSQNQKEQILQNVSEKGADKQNPKRPKR